MHLRIRISSLVLAWLGSVSSSCGRGTDELRSEPKEVESRGSDSAIPTAMEPVPATSSRTPERDVCEEIRNASFRSLENLSSFVGPYGPATGPCLVQFSGDRVEYGCSDTPSLVEYVCSDGEISLKATALGRIHGRFDASNGMLTWCGHLYERVIWNGREFERSK